MFRINTMKLFLIILSSLVAFVPTYSQIIYKSTSGHIIATAIRNSQRVFVESHQSIVTFNYQAMTVVVQTDLRFLETGIDSLDKALRSGLSKLASFEGKAAINDINLSGHPQRSFDLTGNLTLNSVTKPLRFKATLSHLASANNNACLLSASSTIALRDFSLQLPDFSDVVNIEIVQVVLRRQAK